MTNKIKLIYVSEIRSARESECYRKADLLCADPAFAALRQGCEWWSKRCVRDNATQATSVS